MGTHFPTVNELAMTKVLRWLAVVPAALFSFVAVFMLLAPLRGLLLRFCPASDLGTEWTSDLSLPSRVVSMPTCYAAWFPDVEMALLVFALMVAVGGAGCAAALVAPSRKLVCGLSAAGLVILHMYLLSRFS